MRIFCLFCCFIFAREICAQATFYRNYTNEQGLPSNEVYRVVPAQNGYLWICSDGGLVRFDGKNFQPFRNKDQVANSITGAVEDAQGRIWVADFTGRVFYVEADSLYLFKEWDYKKSDNYVIPKVVQGKYLIINSQKEISVYDVSKRPFRNIKRDTHFARGTFDFVKDDTYYGTTDSVVYSLQAPEFVFKAQTQILGLKRPVSTVNLCRFFSINKTVYFLLPNEGPNIQEYTLCKTTNTTNISLQKFHNARINSIEVLGEKIYICSNEGVKIAHIAADTLQFEQGLFEDKMISYLSQDNEHNLWLATLKNGIYCIPNLNYQQYALPNMWENNSISCLESTEKGLIIGLSDGRLMRLLDNKFEMIENQIQNHYVSAIYYHNNQLYYGNNTFKIYNFATHQIQNIVNSYPGANQIKIGLGNRIIASGVGLNIMETPESTPEENPIMLQADRKKFPTGYFYPLSRIRGFVLFEDEKKILLAQKDGLIAMTEKGYHPVMYQDTNIFPLHILQKDSLVWVADIMKGIYAISASEHIDFYPFPAIKNLKIRKMVASEKYIWLLSDNALLRFDLQTKAWTFYGKEETGIPINSIEFLQCHEGYLYLAKGKTLIKIPEDKFLQNKYLPMIILKGIYQGETFIPYQPNLIFPYANAPFALQLEGIAFRGEGNFRFAYKFENDKKWTFCDQNQSRLGFGKLADGDYNIIIAPVDARSNIGVERIYFSFRILPPWWKHPFFLLALIVAISLIWYGFTQYRIRLGRKQNAILLEKEKLEKELKNSQLAAIKSQMNPHFIFNALNTIQNFIYRNEPDQANYFLSRFSQLMRKILDMSNHESISLSEEIEALNLYLQLEKMRFSDNLHYTLSVDAQLDVDYINIPSMLVQPFVENAIKHGLLHKAGEKILQISFDKIGENFLKVKIEDNGVGITRSMEINKKKMAANHTSYAIDANRKRLAILNAQSKAPISCEIKEKWNAEGNSEGTTVTLTIPIDADFS